MTKGLFTVCIVLLTLTNACSDSGPSPYKPKPLADFIIDKPVIELGYNVHLTNHSKYATSYFWDFGNGVTSTQIDPEITYQDTGTYKVRLIAMADDSTIDSTKSTIIVGRRYLSGFSLNKMLLRIDTILVWDTTDGADVFVKYGENQDNLLATATDTNIYYNSFPVKYSVPEGILLTDKLWFFQLYEEDEFSNDSIIGWEKNLYYETYNYLTGNGSYKLTGYKDGDYELEVEFKIK